MTTESVSPAGAVVRVTVPEAPGGPGGSGGARCVVPKLKGKKLAKSKKLLKRAGCKLGKVKRKRSRRVRRGRVISSKPKAGASRQAGTAVKLVVSRGK